MNCIVRVNKTLADDYFYLSLEPATPLGGIRPGSFVMIRCSHWVDPFLRRPMSVADFEPDGSRFGLIVKMAGRGTQLLSTLVPWDHVDVLGPFGSGFEIPDGAGRVWLVAGGTGIAPFLGLVENTAEGAAEFTLFYGAGTADHLLCVDRFSDRGARVVTATEDGSEGFTGFVTSPLVEAFDRGEKPDVVFACGPAAMMRETARICGERGTRCFVSLENRMACGFGACLGCVTKVADGHGYVTVCRKGPVFDAAEVEI